MFAKKFLVATVLAALTSTVFAAGSVLGTWNGKVIVDSASLPKASTPQMKQQLDQMMSMIKSMRIKLNLKADHTYVATATGGPMKKTDTDTGKWTQSGNKITITPNKKANQTMAQKSETLVVSADGKTLTMVIPAGMKGKVVFTK